MFHRKCFSLVPKPWHNDTSIAGILLEDAGSSGKGGSVFGTALSIIFAEIASGWFLAGESDRHHLYS